MFGCIPLSQHSGDPMTSTRTRYAIGFGAALLLAVSAAQAAPVNGTGLVAPNMIFGSGNGNGGFTGVVANDIELGLRAKQRYPAANVFNYDGDQTYTFDTSILTTNPANRSVFNFEWSINVEGTGNQIGDYDYLLQVDRDPTAGTDFSNPSNTVVLYAPGVLKDHSFGTLATAGGAGVEATDLAEFSLFLSQYTVSQQSWNLGFEGFSSDPDQPGSFRVNLQVFEKGTRNVLAATGINVNVLPLPVPEPGSLSLMLASLAALVAVGRRRARRAS
ncbi:MAG: PEP-CTERM sorting domain-containing protein [Rhodoferax sp.]|nr:PEP-CTERM sorting domain-containing protein [Rhodoferax sp.]